MHKMHMKVVQSKRGQGGFSLIELAIVMVVIGLLFLPLIKYYDIYRMQKVKGDTLDRQIALNSALTVFFASNGRYPCPADRSIPFGQPNHGKENCAAILSQGLNSCGGSGAGGFCHVNTGGDRAMIGSIPYVELDIPYSDTLDGWNRAMTYVVSDALADPSVTFNANNAAVTVEGLDSAGSPLFAGKQHGVIISYGANGFGSFDMYGVRTPCNTAVREGENCNDNNATFVTNEANGASLGDNNQYYDDIISVNAWNTSSIWEFDDPDADPSTANENVTATVPGNLGIGTKTPTEKLEVVGGLRTDKIQSFEICDVNGDNCFPSTTIGGDGPIKCPDGQVLTGIAYNQPICKPLPVTGVQSKTCPAGTVVTAIVNGVIQCGTP